MKRPTEITHAILKDGVIIAVFNQSDVEVLRVLACIRGADTDHTYTFRSLVPQTIVVETLR